MKSIYRFRHRRAVRWLITQCYVETETYRLRPFIEVTFDPSTAYYPYEWQRHNDR